MHQQTVLIVACLLLGSSGVTAQSDVTPQVYADTEAYRVYSVLLPHEESAELAKGTLVIQEESQVDPEPPETCLPNEDRQKFAEAIADYKRVNRKPWLLQRHFEVQNPYQIVSTETIHVLLKQGGW